MVTYRTPHMNMTIPDNNEPGPAYAGQDISGSPNTFANGCLYFLGEHTHDGINTGPLINIAAQEIENDLSLDGYNLSNIRGVILNKQGAPLTGIIDLNEIYDVAGDLYFNDGAGNVIRITENGALNYSSFTGFENLSIKNISNANYTIQITDVETALDISSTTAPVVVTLPIAATVSPGRFYFFFDIGNAAATNNITIQVPGGSGNTISSLAGTAASSFVLNTNGQSGMIWTDGISTWYLSLYQQTVFNGGSVLLQFLNGATIQVSGGGGIQVAAGAIEALAGTTLLVDGTSTLNMESGATLSGTMTVADGAEISMGIGSTFATNGLSSTTFANIPVFNDGLTVSSSGITTISNSMVVNGSGLLISPSIGGPIGTPLSFNSCYVPMIAAGTITLANNQYSCPVIDTYNGGSGITTLTGNVAIVFPNLPGSWDVIIGNITFNGHSLLISNFNSITTTFSSTMVIIRVVQTSGSFLAGAMRL